MNRSEIEAVADGLAAAWKEGGSVPPVAGEPMPADKAPPEQMDQNGQKNQPHAPKQRAVQELKTQSGFSPKELRLHSRPASPRQEANEPPVQRLGR